jgi:hypothetical protein
MVAPGTRPDRIEMRFTVFHAASISPARLLAAAKRAVQAEKDRHPLSFPSS